MYHQEQQSVSVKELRQNFPKLAENLAKGNSFILIHRSKPIARIMPYSGIPASQSNALQFWSKPLRKNRISKKMSSVALVKKERS
ncbi:MAG: hypothetical protein AAB400_01385 [Patescibacteria group bacterium]